MSRDDLARRLVLQAAILRLLGAADDDTRTEARDEYRPGAADPVEVDGVPFGRVRMDKPRKSVTVVSWDELTRWVTEHAPDMLVQSWSVNPAFVAALKRSDGEWTDPATGEVVTVPGVGVTETRPALVVEVSDAAAAWARETLRGSLGYTPLPELED